MPSLNATTQKKIFQSIWLFPALLFLILLFLTALKISGSSVGEYDQLLYGNGYKDPALVYGKPQPIRSDEWVVATPFAVSQSHNNFRPINTNLAPKQDVSVLLDIPYKDWSEIFKPQNWAFFVLQLEMAAAFHWWILDFLVVVSCYFFVLQILPKHRLEAALTGILAGLSPFLLWWYFSVALTPIFYTFFIATVLIKIWGSRGGWKLTVGYGALLSYLLVCFALILYPPDQIPCALTLLAFFIGYTLPDLRAGWKIYGRRLLPILIAVMASLIMVGIFFLTRLDTIHAITNTVYPGHRTVQSGHFNFLHLLDGAYNMQLQDAPKALHYIDNQSESSNFIAFWPFFLIPSTFLFFRAKKRSPSLYVLAGLSALLAIFSLDMFVPMPALFSKVVLLSFVPHNRLLIGFGIVGLFQLIMIVKALQTEALPKRLVVLTALSTFALELGVGLGIRHSYPGFLHSGVKIILISLTMSLIIYLLLSKKTAWALGLAVLLSAVSVYRVHPLYRGLGPLTNSSIVQAVQHQNDTSKGWAYIGGAPFINLLSAAGVKTYTHVYLYPEFSLWNELDPSKRYSNVYNRYAFSIFQTDQSRPFQLIQPDAFSVAYDPCSSTFSHKIERVLSLQQLLSPCTHLLQTVTYPSATFYIYAVN